MDAMLAADVMLLATHDEKGTGVVTQFRSDAALVAAVVLDLVLVGVLDVEDSAEDASQRRFRRGSVPVTDPLLSDVVDHLDGKKMKDGVQAVYRRSAAKIRTALLEQLTASGDLRQERRNVWGIFPTTTHPAGDTGREQATVRRLAAALDGPLPPDQRTCALLAILQASEILGEVFPGRPGRELKARVAELTEGDWVGESVRAVIQAVQAAVAVAAVIVTTT